MSIHCVQPSTCHAKKYGQQGFMSMVAMILLVVMIFMGRGLLVFLQQGTENSYSLRQKMRMRLVAESMAEKQGNLVRMDESRLQNLRDNSMILLDQGKDEGLDYTVFARSWGGEIYIIATAFCRETTRDKLLEPHMMVKGVLVKEGEHYVWRGWAP